MTSDHDPLQSLRRDLTHAVSTAQAMIESAQGYERIVWMDFHAEANQLLKRLRQIERATDAMTHGVEPTDRRLLLKSRTLFPDGWTLSPADAEPWRQHGIDPYVEFASFRDHARTYGRLCRDWPAAWRNWARKAIRLAKRG